MGAPYGPPRSFAQAYGQAQDVYGEKIDQWKLPGKQHELATRRTG